MSLRVRVTSCLVFKFVITPHSSFPNTCLASKILFSHFPLVTSYKENSTCTYANSPGNRANLLLALTGDQNSRIKGVWISCPQKTKI